MTQAQEKKTAAAPEGNHKKKRRMSKQVKGIIISVAVVAVLLGAFFIVQSLPDNTPESEPANDYVTLFDVSADDIARVDVARSGGGFSLLKDQVTGVYVLEGYEDVKVSEAQATLLMGAASAVRSIEEVEITGAPDSDYGLDDPMSFTVTLWDGTVHRFELGAVNVFGTGYYGRVSGDDTIYLFQKSLLTRIYDSTAEALVDKTLIPKISEEDPQVTYIEILNGENHVVIDEAPDTVRYTFNSYRLVKPVEYPPADQTINEQIVSIVSAIAAESVVSLDTPANIDEELPVKFSITIQGKTHVLHFSQPQDGKRLCAKDGVRGLFQISETFCGFLGLGFENLASSSFLVKYIDTFDKMLVKTPDKTYTFEASGELDDLVVVMDGRTLDEDGVANFRSFYSGFLSIVRQDKAEDPGAGVESLLTVTFENRDGTTEIYEYVPIDGRRCYVRTNGEGYFDTLTKNVEAVIENIGKLERGEKVKS